MKTKVTGDIGEEFLCFALRRRGWKILQRNYRIPGSEIDLIAGKGNTVLFGEVKTRQQVNNRPLFLTRPDLGMSRKALPMFKGISSYLAAMGQAGNEFQAFENILVYCFVVAIDTQKCRCNVTAAFPLDLEFFDLRN